MSIRTISEQYVSVDSEVCVTELEITEAGETHISWSWDCEHCGDGSNNLEEDEAFDEAAAHTCPEDDL